MSMLTVISVGVKKNDRASVVWFNIMLALLLWFLSEVIFTYYPLALMVTPPFPSLADGFDLLAYLPLMIGLLIAIWPFGAEIWARWNVKVAWLVLAIVSLLVLYRLLPLIFRSSLNFAGVIVRLSLPDPRSDRAVCRLFHLLCFSAEVRFGDPNLFLITGLVLAAVDDIWYGFANLSGTYYVGLIRWN